MKTAITKQLFAFIILVFSVSLVNAQFCVCDCAGQPKHNAECFTKSNGSVGCKHSRCRYRFYHAASTPDVTFLTDIYPNPASTSTTVSFYAGQTENVSLKLFDVNGRLVTTLADAAFDEGDYEIIWTTPEENAGVYFLRMETANHSEIHKLMITK